MKRGGRTLTAVQYLMVSSWFDSWIIDVGALAGEELLVSLLERGYRDLLILGGVYRAGDTTRGGLMSSCSAKLTDRPAGNRVTR